MTEEYKGYEIYPDGTFGMKLVKNSGSGTIPKVLRGSFSNNVQAQRSIDRYLDTKVSVKEKSNAKTGSAS